MTMTGHWDPRTWCRLACALPAAVMWAPLVAALLLADLSSTVGRVVAAGAVVVGLAVLAGAVVAGGALADRVDEDAAQLVTTEAVRARRVTDSQVHERCGDVRALLGRSLDELHLFADAVSNGARPVPAGVGERPVESGDLFELIAYDVHRFKNAAQWSVLATAQAADRETEPAAVRRVDAGCGGLREQIARGVDELHRFARAVSNGERLVPADAGERPAEPADPFALVAHDMRRFQVAVQRAVLEAAEKTKITRAGLPADVVNPLALRMQARIHRALQVMEQIQGQVDDPDLLGGLYTVDHLVVLVRRQAENLAVIGGGVSRRSWSSPVSVTTAVRAAVQEIEHYSRVRWVRPMPGWVRGDVAADIIHLLAELVENATEFSPNHEVWIRVEQVPAGLAIEIEDKGIGFPSDADRRRMNELLADPAQITPDELLRDGRIGLWVVGNLAGRHGVTVELKKSQYWGVLAVVVLPQELINPVAVPSSAQAAAAADPSAPASAAALVPATRSEYRSSNGSRHQHEVSPDGRSAAALPAALPAAPPAGRDNEPAGPEEQNGQDGPGGEGGEGDLPPLPRRVKQENLVPQLRRPAAVDSGDIAAAADTNVQEFAALLTGFRAAEASPTDASPTDASPTDASPTDASPTDVFPTEAGPTGTAGTAEADHGGVSDSDGFG